MKSYWLFLATKVEAMTLRERIFILLAGLALIWMPGYTLWLEPANARNEAMRVQLAGAEKNRQELESQLSMVQSVAQSDPDAVLRGELIHLRQRLQEVDEKMSLETVDLIAPERMPMVLQSLLASAPGVTLSKIYSMSGQPMLGENEKINLFQHGIHIELQGSFFALVNYLQKIEALPERFYWRNLDYRVGNYPAATVTLELYTLSTSKDFIRG
jgi:hypothetical protein